MSTTLSNGHRTTRQTDPIRLDLPPVYCPITPPDHPRGAEFQRRGLAWLTRCGLLPDDVARTRSIDTNSHNWFPRIAPAAPDERNQINVDWCYLAYAFDDVCCDEGEFSVDTARFVDLTARLVRELEAPHAGLMPKGDPFGVAVRELISRASAYTTPTVLRRWADTHRAWLAGVAWQTATRERGMPLTLNDYATMRMLSCAGPPVVVMFEIAEGEVPAQEINAPAVRALTESACLVAAWDNDMHSYGKELWFARQPGHPRDVPPANIVDVLIQQDDLDVAEALALATEMRDRVLHLFIELREQVLPTASEPLRRYLVGLGNMVTVSIETGLVTARYRNPDGRHPDAVEVTGGQPHPNPPRHGLTPLALPTIAWWWEQLA